MAVESRHLGLKMAHESGNMGEFGTIIEESCDLDALVAAAHQAPPMKKRYTDDIHDIKDRCKIGIALDDAFCFYYQDNLDLLSRAGAKPGFFQPAP